MDHDDGSTIDAPVVRSHLNERVQAGRTPGEAAGEILFAEDKQLSLGALSRQSRAEISEIVDAWLTNATYANSLPTHRSVATLYARFLTERVTWELSINPRAEIDAAWQEWRSRSKTGPP